MGAWHRTYPMSARACVRARACTPYCACTYCACAKWPFTCLHKVQGAVIFMPEGGSITDLGLSVQTSLKYDYGTIYNRSIRLVTISRASNVYLSHTFSVLHISVIRHEHYYFYYIIWSYYKYIIIHLFIGVTVT